MPWVTNFGGEGQVTGGQVSGHERVTLGASSQRQQTSRARGKGQEPGHLIPLLPVPPLLLAPL